MSVHYIGRTTSFSGKRLYDYLSRLKDWGVGRIVYRNTFFERYPEKTYYVITRVEPHMMDRMQQYNKKEFGETHEPFKSVAFGEYIFRGKEMGEKRIDSGWKADWRLVPKEQEEEFLKIANSVKRPPKRISKEAPLPPLLEHFLKQQMEEAGTPLTEKPVLTLPRGKARYFDELTD